MDKLSTVIGCRPNFWRIIFRDPRLFSVLFPDVLSLQVHTRMYEQLASSTASLRTILDVNRKIERPLDLKIDRRRADEYLPILVKNSTFSVQLYSCVSFS